MTRMRRLMLEAKDSATFRGHKMGKWKIHNKNVAENICLNCGKWVQVDCAPMPNGIDIGGPAVALGCEDK
jgi:hypothetical protein